MNEIGDTESVVVSVSGPLFVFVSNAIHEVINWILYSKYKDGDVEERNIVV